MVLASAGEPQYKIRLKDVNGNIKAEFDTWRSLSFTHKVNQRGVIRFEIDGEDERITLFALDAQIEVWRRNPMVALDWYIEWEGFIRTTNDGFSQFDNNSFVVYGFSYLDLARRAHIMYDSLQAEATKSAPAETVIKEFVNENIGANALIANGREDDNVLLGLTIEADGAVGSTWDGSEAYENLGSVIAKVSLNSARNNLPVDFDIVGTGDATFEFRTYESQRGLDRTEGNSDGNDEVKFSLGLGNMIVPILSKNRSKEKNVIYALGRGNDDQKQIGKSEDIPAQTSSPWNRVEGTTSASVTTGDDQSDQLQDAATEQLQQSGFDEQLNFAVLQIPNSYYGLHYTWGDKITAEYKDSKFDKKIVEARVTVSDNVGGEKIELIFADETGIFVQPSRLSQLEKNELIEKETDVTANLQESLIEAKDEIRKLKKRSNDGIEIKDTAGDFSDGWEGRLVVNTADGTVKIRSGGGFVTII